MIWKLVRSLPKVALVLGVLLASTGMFAYWWYFRSPVRREENRAFQEHKQEQIRKTVAEVETRVGHLLLVDNDLYDLDTGTIFFQHWLNGNVPRQLFYDAATKKLIANYGPGFIRYALDGTKEATVGGRYGMVFSEDLKTAMFARDKNIWRADLDWNEWKSVNEKQITSVGQFMDQNFIANILLRTDKTLVMRSANQLLRVSLENGEVHPTKPPLVQHHRQRSPDGKSVVGIAKSQFYCYDVDSEAIKTIPVARQDGMDDYQWLDHDRCVCIARGRSIKLYDRAKNSLQELVNLPAQCQKFGEFSPDKRFVFCGSRKARVLVDLKQKTATPVSGGQGVSWVSNDTFTFSRELPDSTLRGTWLQTAGSTERRVSPEPFVVRDKLKPVLLVKSEGLVVFITKEGVMRMKPDGSELATVLKITTASSRPPQLPSRLTDIGDWKSKQAMSDDDTGTEDEQ